MASTVHTLLAICTLILYVKYLLATVTRARRSFAAGTRPSEDASLSFAKGKPQGFDYEAQQDEAGDRAAAIEAEKRWKAIVQSDLESIPASLLVFVITLVVGASENWTSVLVIVYTVMRLLHTICFASKMAFPRLITSTISVICVLISVIVAFIHVL